MLKTALARSSRSSYSALAYSPPLIGSPLRIYTRGGRPDSHHLCKDRHLSGIMDKVQEVFSKTIDPKTPLKGQEFYELRIDDSVDISRPGFVVVEAHAKWSDADQRIEWDDAEYEGCETYEQAEDRYEIRRRRLIEKGFTYSDMDALV